MIGFQITLSNEILKPQGVLLGFGFSFLENLIRQKLLPNLGFIRSTALY